MEGVGSAVHPLHTLPRSNDKQCMKIICVRIGRTKKWGFTPSKAPVAHALSAIKKLCRGCHSPVHAPRLHIRNDNSRLHATLLSVSSGQHLRPKGAKQRHLVDRKHWVLQREPRGAVPRCYPLGLFITRGAASGAAAEALFALSLSPSFNRRGPCPSLAAVHMAILSTLIAFSVAKKVAVLTAAYAYGLPRVYRVVLRTTRVHVAQPSVRALIARSASRTLRTLRLPAKAVAAVRASFGPPTTASTVATADAAAASAAPSHRLPRGAAEGATGNKASAAVCSFPRGGGRVGRDAVGETSARVQDRRGLSSPDGRRLGVMGCGPRCRRRGVNRGVRRRVLGIEWNPFEACALTVAEALFFWIVDLSALLCGDVWGPLRGCLCGCSGAGTAAGRRAACRGKSGAPVSGTPYGRHGRRVAAATMTAAPLPRQGAWTEKETLKEGSCQRCLLPVSIPMELLWK